MKNLNEQQNQESNLNTELNPSAKLEFGDVVVYHEMADHTEVRLNLIDQLHSQLNQLDEMVQRKNFMMKEIFNDLILK